MLPSSAQLPPPQPATSPTATTAPPSTYGAPYANSRNTGMADLVAALAWIRDNIDVFNGDPGNVTISGQSGGGGKVTRLVHMPAAQDIIKEPAAVCR